MSLIQHTCVSATQEDADSVPDHVTVDPHGADNLGNPLGGLVYSTNLPGGDNSTYIQAWNWNNFIGSNEFCFKICYNNVTSPDYCQNKFDLIGCSYNMPSNNTEGEFVKCDGDLQDEVGTYTGTDGSTTVWSQPDTLAADYTMPYTPRIPASSNCVTYSSEELFGTASTTAAAASATATTSSGAAATDAASSAAGASSGSAVATSGASAQDAVASASATSSTTSGAVPRAVGGSALLPLAGMLACILAGVAVVA